MRCGMFECGPLDLWCELKSIHWTYLLCGEHERPDHLAGEARVLTREERRTAVGLAAAAAGAIEE